MSPAQQDPDPEPASRHAYPRTRYRRQSKATESEAPLAHLRRRYANSAVAASIGYLVVFVTAAVRPTVLDDAAFVGLLIALGAIAGLCALGAILAWAVAQMPVSVAQASLEQRADDLEWAYQLGAIVAGASPAAREERSAPRGPNIR